MPLLGGINKYAHSQPGLAQKRDQAIRDAQRRRDELMRRNRGGRTNIYQPLRMEQIVRPFVDVLSFRAERRQPPVIEDLPEAFIEWGGPSQFEFDNSFRNVANSGRSFRVNDDGDDPDPGTSWSEAGRTTSDVRVENPEDPEQYVIVQRIDSISFNTPGGKISLSLSHPS